MGVQSIELLLDTDSEAALRAEWAVLAAAGLPTEQRNTPSPSHRPHVTLWAGSVVPAEAEVELPALFADLALPVRIGAVLCFPARTSYVLVRQVVALTALLSLQQAVQELCGPGLGGQFDAGAWVPHATLARRVPPERVGPVLDALRGGGSVGERAALVVRARRWDGVAKREWVLGP